MHFLVVSSLSHVSTLKVRFPLGSLGLPCRIFSWRASSHPDQSRYAPACALSSTWPSPANYFHIRRTSPRTLPVSASTRSAKGKSSIPIPDLCLSLSVGYVRQILDVLKDELDNERRGRITAVHYRSGGIGRTCLVESSSAAGSSNRGGGRRGGAAVHRGGVEVG